MILSFDLAHLMNNGDFDTVRDHFAREHAADIAAAVGELDPRTGWGALELLSAQRQAVTFGYLDRDFQVELASIVPRAKLAAIVSDMNADERADLYNELSEDQREKLMPALAHAEREDVRRLAGYGRGTAGALMTSDYATLTPELTATQALSRLRREAPDKETIYRTYVIDEKRKLIGSARLQDIITMPAQTSIADIMETNTHAVNVADDQEAVARKIAHYDLLALPVVDGEGCIVGIITHDDALDVIEEEATDDFHRVATVTNLTASVAHATIWMLYRARIVWLVVLVFGNVFSGAGIAYFEATIQSYVVLVFFLPLLIDSGGNAGSQSATLMVRALATGDVKLADWSSMIGRELLVAACLGLTMALAVSLISVYRGGPEIAMVVSSSMVIIVLVGSAVGMSLPFLLSLFGVDPATASAPLVTSIADIVGVLIYFTIATVFLPMPG